MLTFLQFINLNEEIKSSKNLLRGDFKQIMKSAHGITKYDHTHHKQIKNALVQTYNIHAPFHKDNPEEFKSHFLKTFEPERKLVHKGNVNEAAHSAGSMVHDWGVISPKTGALISGQKHPTATTHHFFKKSLINKKSDVHISHYPEYVHYNSSEHGNTMQVRSHNTTQHHALLKGIKNLPTANHYEHGRIDNKDNEHFHDFDNVKSLHNHVSKLASGDE